MAGGDIPAGTGEKGGEPMRNIYGIPGVFGGEDFYDESGRKIGYSIPGILGGEDFYDTDGTHAGYGVPGIFGGKTICLEDDPFSAGPPDDYDFPGCDE